LLACLALVSGAEAGAQARLTARPQAEVVQALPAGVSTLGKGAFVYRPELDATVRPGVIVLFHGAGGDARRFIELFRGEADRRRMLLISIQSTERTWDVVLRGSRDTWNVGRAAPVNAPGIDSRHVNAALNALFKKTPVDRDRVIAMGFSDGASYALSIGLRNDQLFSGVVALAPGFADETDFRRPQRIAVAHGQYDRILSFERAERMTRDLGNRGYPVEFISFPGDHMVDSGSLAKALDFVLGAGRG
jgi:predicted esterase